MKINRAVDGNELSFELTKQELYEAFREQKYNLFLEEIEYAIESFNDGAEKEINMEKVLSDEDLCKKIIRNYEDCLYETDSERWYSTVEENVPEDYYLAGG